MSKHVSVEPLPEYTSADAARELAGVTAAKGFRASGVTAGLKPSGKPDVALVVNDGPDYVAAGVFTTNRVCAAPVRVSRAALERNRSAHAMVLNSGGANACTGQQGLADALATRQHVSDLLGCEPDQVQVASTGMIGVLLPMDTLLAGTDDAFKQLSVDGGADAAHAIMTTDTVAKQAQVSAEAGYTIGGMAKGAGMLAPGLATMLVCITTDAVIEQHRLEAALQQAVEVSFNRADSDGCMSTNDTVLIMSSGASGVKADEEFEQLLASLCVDLARQLLSDAEGASHDIAVTTINAASEADALEVSRAVARSNLFKTAIFGNDPNWGRVVSEVGTTQAAFEPENLSVAMNGVWVARNGGVGDSRELVDLSAQRDVHVEIDLHAGEATATIWTNDLTHDYVEENSAYST
ncbi:MULTISPECIES: bifunctional glutamate N-acetyltransferase/amino-acid acetyltransferase ArgJ [Micrococcaceae]|uniref:bifunctional glutamate N-acetyltransferase/amino-acid acetyltransferase ArgJ n=1 Tax=Micrococcaceae TaxID=1268 RepID=UPI0009F62333|nr:MULTISPECIES: bifunctional glutamate N-acetyltransferase/amino-acid acetyltransferase ArgJ [Micrococcaceae]MCG7304501.1 bifunctional glutamate N-acetyltransferase/amino-acid acetyltransferase ArgJ [Pseudoglutamicibacter albus]